MLNRKFGSSKSPTFHILNVVANLKKNMDSLIRITKNINFADLRSGRKLPVDVFEEQMQSWIIRPLEQLSADRINSFENGYAMLGLELLFFEPHGKYISGNTINGSRKTFDYGFERFRKFLMTNNLISQEMNDKIENTNFYKISRCGIFHDMTIKSGLLIDSINMDSTKVFYHSPINDGILVNPWNFLNALKDYLENYVSILRNDNESQEKQNFELVFNSLFQY